MSDPSSTDLSRLEAGRRAGVGLVGLGLALSVGVIVLLTLGMLPTGVPGQWEWPWRAPDFFHPLRVWLVLPIYGVPLALLLWWLGRPRISRRAAAGLIALCCLAAASSMVVLETEEPVWPLHLATATASLPATGYFSYATAVSDVPGLFAALSGRSGQATMPPRVQTHPPGPVLFYYLGLRLLAQVPELTLAVEDWAARTYALTPGRFQALSHFTAMPSVQAYHFALALILGMACTLLGAVLPVPVYLILATLHSRRAGLIGALLAAAIPSVVVFIPSIDGVAAMLALLPVALWLRGLQGRSPWWFIATGAALLAALFWSFGLAAVTVAMAAAAVPALRDPATRQRVLAGALAAAAVVGGAYVLLLTFGGYNVLGNVRLAVHWQTIDVSHSKRSYVPWLTGNLYDVMLFMGPALLAATCAALPLLGKLSATARSYLAGAFIALGLVWLSGSTLGEVGRIWLFLMGALVPGAGLALAELAGRRMRWLLAAMMTAQAVLMVTLHGWLALVQA